METDSLDVIEPINIGKIIEEELRRQERSVTWFSRKLHCDRRNVYDIFTRQYIDTYLLYRISVILKKDFFAIFSNSLNRIDNQKDTPPPILQWVHEAERGICVNFISQECDGKCRVKR